MRAELGLEGRRILLTAGRMSSREQYKGHERVITALPHLVAAGHDIVYLIVGEGDDRERLEDLVRERKLENYVRFLGPVSASHLVSAYRMADLFVMPSTGEGFGIVFLEAMACGTPALGLAVAGARDALGEGTLGIAVSEEELTTTLARQLEQPKSDSHVLSTAVRARFGSENFCRSVNAVFERLLIAA